MRTNFPRHNPNRTHEGGVAQPGNNPERELVRTTINCLLFEDTFYEAGNDIAGRIADLCTRVKPEFIADLAVKARTEYSLRHAPLWLTVQLARRRTPITKDTLPKVIRRADELAEFLSLYWKDKKQPIAASVKKGLAAAFANFEAYHFAKYNRDNAIKLRDVMFLTHPKPADEARITLYKQIAEDTLPIPDTWEVAISAAKSPEEKRDAWTRLIEERKLGSFALLRNLRNMEKVSVDRKVIERGFDGANFKGILPFQFVAALRAAPQALGLIEAAMLKCVDGWPKLEGTTWVVVDVSGSMDAALSKRGTLTRLDAASALAVLVNETSSGTRVFTFSNGLAEVAAYRGLALVEAVSRSQTHGGTYIGKSLEVLRDKVPGSKPDRLVVITDEQAHDRLPACWTKHGYVINTAPYQHGLEVDGGWTRINGFSERAVEWMRLNEAEIEGNGA